jgi:uncharacterized membrane protein YphA (DoxX/SURF4 family)
MYRLHTKCLPDRDSALGCLCARESFGTTQLRDRTGDATVRSFNRMAISSTKALTGLRVAVGILFVIFGEYKVFGAGFTIGGGFQYWINRFLQDGAYPFMVPVLKNFVLPHATPIAFLVAYGELAIGIALMLGILVRPASVCGMIYMFTLLFSANYPGPHAAFWQYFGASLEHLVLALCFASFASTKQEDILSLRTYLRSHRSM